MISLNYKKVISEVAGRARKLFHAHITCFTECRALIIARYGAVTENSHTFLALHSIFDFARKQFTQLRTDVLNYCLIKPDSINRRIPEDRLTVQHTPSQKVINNHFSNTSLTIYTRTSAQYKIAIITANLLEESNSIITFPFRTFYK